MHSFGPLYYKGSCFNYIPVAGAGTVAHAVNGYDLQNISLGVELPVQLMGFGIYCSRHPCINGHELWLSSDPEIVKVDAQFLLDNGFPCTRMTVREQLVNTIKYTDCLRKKYKAIWDKNTGYICIYDSTIILEKKND